MKGRAALGKVAGTVRNRIWSLWLGVAPLALLAATAAGQAGMGQRGGEGVTHLRVTGDVVLAGVTRLGVNLGSQSFYDSGQMLKNLVSRNPGFEGMSYRSILHCDAGGNSFCIDRRQGLKFPADFWNGASFEVLDGMAAGRRGAVASSGPQSGGYGVTFDSKGRALGDGDWIAVAKDFPGDPAAGWWPSLQGGAELKAERADLSPATLGHQALRIEAAGPGQSAQINSFFDTTEGISFVRLRGRYRLSFRAKALAGSRMLHVHVGRNVAGKPAWLEMDVRVGPAWTDYAEDFAASDPEGPTGPVGRDVWLDGRIDAAG